MVIIKMGVHVVAESTKSGVHADPIPGGRPRLSVDYALVLRLREQDNLGWSLVAQRYREITGQFVSRDTMKRRYFEGKGLENNPDGQASQPK